MSLAEASVAWGLDSETGVLRDVLLGKPDYFDWRPVSAVARHTLSRGLKFNAQHVRCIAEMVGATRRRVTYHWLEAAASSRMACSRATRAS